MDGKVLIRALRFCCPLGWVPIGCTIPNSALPSGALKYDSDTGARNPVLATINGTVYCTWIEKRKSKATMLLS